MKLLRAIAGLVALAILGLLGLVLLIVTFSERLVNCGCSHGTRTGRMVSGNQVVLT